VVGVLKENNGHSNVIHVYIPNQEFSASNVLIKVTTKVTIMRKCLILEDIAIVEIVK